MNDDVHYIENEQVMLAFASQFSQKVSSGDVIYLMGDLGMGKTTFSRGFLQGVGYSGRVKSPTYGLVESYEVESLVVHHFDLYRLTSPEELYDIGMEDYFDRQAVCLIEWPEKAARVLPSSTYELQFSMQKNGRNLRVNHGQNLSPKR